MDSHLENELTLHIEFRDDRRESDKIINRDIIITKRPDGYVQYERDIEITGPAGADKVREIDCLQMHRATFRIEIHPRLGSFDDWKHELKILYDFFSKLSEKTARDLCNKEGSDYVIFTLGKNYQDIDDSKETLKWRGHYYLQFDDGFENLFIVPGVRKMLKKRDIIQETQKVGWAQTQIFLRSFSVQALKGVFAKFNRMYELAIDLQIQLNDVYSSFAKMVSWKKKGDIKIYPGRLKKGLFK
jgi:hypothetical protein